MIWKAGEGEGEVRLNEKRVLTYPIPFSMRRKLSLGFKKSGITKNTLDLNLPNTCTILSSRPT